MKQPDKNLKRWADVMEDKRRRAELLNAPDQHGNPAYMRRFEDHEQERLAKHVELPPIYRAVQYVKDNQDLFAIIAICSFFVIWAMNV